MSRIRNHLFGSPWFEQFPRYRDSTAIRQAATVRASPVAGLTRLPPREAERLLTEALERIYIPGEQHCSVLLDIVDDVRAFIGERYPDARRYLARINCAESPPTAIRSVRCLTGLAGVGKTCFLAALKRLLQGDRTARLDASQPDMPIHYVRNLTINTRTSNRDLMLPLANPAFVAGRQSVAMDDLERHVQRWLHAMGVGLLLIDELQFLTQSLTANTRVAQVLMMMGYLGIPVLYAANYSLCHRLLRRPQEERQRLLVAPIDLRPEEPDSPAWQELVAEYVRVAPDIFRIDAARDARELNHLTAGINRLLRFLFVEAFRRACDRAGHRVVTMDDIRTVYRSRKFSAMREDVEALGSLSTCHLLHEKRPDLISPFQGEEVGRSRGQGKPDASRRGPASADRARDQPAVVPPAVTYMRESTLSTDARRVLAAMRGNGERECAPAKSRRSERSTSPRVKVTAETLYAGAKLARTLTESPRRKVKGRTDDAA